jgi:hypothetical protein
MPKQSTYQKSFLHVLEQDRLYLQDQGIIQPCARPSLLERQLGAIPKCEIRAYPPESTNRDCPGCRKHAQIVQGQGHKTKNCK